MSTARSTARSTQLTINHFNHLNHTHRYHKEGKTHTYLKITTIKEKHTRYKDTTICLLYPFLSPKPVESKQHVHTP